MMGEKDTLNDAITKAVRSNSSDGEGAQLAAANR